METLAKRILFKGGEEFVNMIPTVKNAGMSLIMGRTNVWNFFLELETMTLHNLRA